MRWLPTICAIIFLAIVIGCCSTVVYWVTGNIVWENLTSLVMAFTGVLWFFTATDEDDEDEGGSCC